MTDQPTERPDRDAPMQGVVDDPHVDVDVNVNQGDAQTSPNRPDVERDPDDTDDDQAKDTSDDDGTDGTDA